MNQPYQAPAIRPDPRLAARMMRAYNDELNQVITYTYQHLLTEGLDTEASELVAKRAFGTFGDPAGYEESLYKTEGGKFFLYTFGGPDSQYAEEGIKRMSAAKADEWLAQA